MGQTYKNLRGRLLVLLGVRGPFRSAQEVFSAVDRLICSLEDRRFELSASSVRRGFAALNGLTDGWADFLADLEKAEAELPPQADPALRRRFKDLIAAARFAVYRP